MLLVCFGIYLKLVPRYKCLILDTCHPDTVYIYLSKDLRTHGCVSKPDGVHEQQTSGNCCRQHGLPSSGFHRVLGWCIWQRCRIVNVYMQSAGGTLPNRDAVPCKHRRHGSHSTGEDGDHRTCSPLWFWPVAVWFIIVCAVFHLYASHGVWFYVSAIFMCVHEENLWLLHEGISVWAGPSEGGRRGRVMEFETSSVGYRPL